MDWHDGYVSDIDYLAEFFRDQGPAHLSFACVLNGVEPVALDRPFTYFELGSGQGLTANVLAASNPQGEFYAADFNPAHIAASRELADCAQLNNMTFLENSFEELAAGKVALPPLDFITLHGVYSWVTPENRGYIVDFIKRYLKPGGVAYLSYNAMPGWTTTLPLQRLILEHVDLHPGSKHQQIQQMRKLVAGLIETEASYFTSNTGANLKVYLNSVMEGDASWSSYIAHEYMNRGWQPLYHADVARELAGAKLDFVGSAGLSWAFPDLIFTPAQQELLAAVPDAAMRETVKDYLKNTCFRKDIFVRGARPMTTARQTEWLNKTGLTLTALRSTVTLDMKFPLNKYSLPEALYVPVLDALAQGPKTLVQLASLPALAGKSMAEVAQIAALLSESEQASTYFLCSAGQDNLPAQRMNRAIAQQARLDSNYRVFASPLLGSGVKAALFQRLVYLSLSLRPEENDADVISGQVWQAMREQQLPVEQDGHVLTSKEEELSAIRSTVKAILEYRKPVWEDLQVLA